MKFYIQNCAFWCILSGFEQLLDMRSSVLQKSLRWSSRAASFDDRLFHAIRRQCCNRSVVLPLFLTKMFLVMFWSEAVFYSRRSNTVVSCTFAAIRLADYTRDGKLATIAACFGNRCAHMTSLTSLIETETNRTLCSSSRLRQY